jgi:hypothetical protein
MNFGASVVNVSVAIRPEPSEKGLQKQRQKNALGGTKITPGFESKHKNP